MSFEEMDKVETCVRDMIKGCLKNDEGIFRIEVHEDSKTLDVGKATWYIGNSWTQNHHVLYTANCQDFQNITDGCAIEDMLNDYESKDEMIQICNEVYQKWEELKQ